MKKWREAASVILAASTNSVPSSTIVHSKRCEDVGKEKPDFQILALKKSRESPFTPGAYVFPGGNVNESDSCVKWSDLFSKFGYQLDKICQSLKNDNTNLPIFEDFGEPLPRCVTLRITAIREAFEESGVLICKRTTAPKYFETDYVNKCKHLEIEDSMTWRKKVMKNHKEFFNLCEENKCYPDLSSLYLWSDWLTPSNMPIRFDSVFFIAVMEPVAPAVPDKYEIDIAKWCHPQEILSECYIEDNDGFLPPPQFYELSRLASVGSFSKLCDFSVMLNKSPNVRWLPVRLFAKDGEMTLLPGDELYPENVSLIEHQVILKEDFTIEDLRGYQMHRLEHKSIERKQSRGIPRYSKLVIENLKPAFNHLQPWFPPVNYLKGHL